MHKMQLVDKVLLGLGAAAINAMLVVFVWPLGLGIVVLLMAFNLFSLFGEREKVLVQRMTAAIARPR
ncbi:hypothetical protein HUU05_20470 [candidate division KSB1 bacterium]|nr:hypothetical protein [candidate division KSB1 bacterium]